jgi:RND family efflux transporter MFP subunit
MWVVIAVVAMVATYFLTRLLHPNVQFPSERHILYYIDPMNPDHTSPMPGFAPCGMKLEPVYADETHETGQANNPIVSPRQISLLGIKTAKVRRLSLNQKIRWPAKVAIDLSRVYSIVAPLDGRIISVLSGGPGTLVNRDECLAAYYSPEFLHPAQVLVYALNAEEQWRTNNHGQVFHTEQPQSSYTDKLPEYTYIDQLAMFARTGQLSQSQLTVKLNLDMLRNLGMGDIQLEDLIKLRRPLDRINLCSPANGFLLTRNASIGQIITKGMELFKVADISKVLVVANVPNRESIQLEQGQFAKVSLFNSTSTFSAKLSNTLTEYDDSTRNALVRFEVDNTNYDLKPGMPVDVEISQYAKPCLQVDVDAVIDTGKTHVVYVSKGDGVFSRKTVCVGHQANGLIEIIDGLEEGDEVVKSGNFLLDGETRIKQSNKFDESKSVEFDGSESVDLVCKMSLNQDDARSQGLVFSYQNKDYYFCNSGCLKKFASSPSQYVKPTLGKSNSEAAGNGAQPSGSSYYGEPSLIKSSHD